MPGILEGLLNGRSYIRKGEEGGRALVTAVEKHFKIRYIFSSTDQNTFFEFTRFFKLKNIVKNLIHFRTM